MRRKLSVRILSSLIISVMCLALPIGAVFSNGTAATAVYAESGVDDAGDVADEGESDADSRAEDDAANAANPANADTSDAKESGNTSDAQISEDDPSIRTEDGNEENELSDTEDIDTDDDEDTASDDSGAEDPSSGSADDGDVSDNSSEDTSEPQEPASCICTDKCGEYRRNNNCPVCSLDYTKCEYRQPNVKISIDIPDGWYSRGTTIKAEFEAEDLLDTGNFAIKTVKAKIGQNGTYQDVTESMSLEVHENCTLYVLVTDAHDKSYERSRAVTCFDTTKPTLNAAVSEGLLTVQAVDNESGVAVVYVNGYEFKKITNGTVNIRLAKFDAGYEWFNITAMDNAGNVSEVYKTKNPYYKDPNSTTNDNKNPADSLPASAEPTQPANATAPVTEHVKTDSDGNTVKDTKEVAAETQTATASTPEAQKKAEFKKADAEENTVTDGNAVEVDKNKGKEFYTVTAASGKNFYLVIDRDGQQEMVYFLTEVTENDLLNVTTDNSQTLPKNSAALESQIPVTESALPNNNTDVDDTHEVETPSEEPEPAADEPEEPAEPEKGSPIVSYIIIGIFAAVAIGAGYYFKVVKKKDDGDFVEDEDEDEEDETFINEDEDQNEEDDFFEEDGNDATGTSDEEHVTTHSEAESDETANGVVEAADDDAEDADSEGSVTEIAADNKPADAVKAEDKKNIETTDMERK